MQPIISVRNVSKYYQFPKTFGEHQPQLGLSDMAGRMSEKGFAALRDITFTVYQGEALGIVGLNGAGKTTLLRILAGITQPSSGTVKLGRAATPLLTLLSGMDVQMSGRQNIYLHGTLLGYSRQHIDTHLSEIIDFADLGEFIDLPMATYSSGMRMRLAFSTSMVMNAGILLIDEVLAVGDLAFQEKALARMRQYFAEGKTIVMTSHNIPSLRSLCRTVLWLDNGEIREIGTANEVLDNFVRASRPATQIPANFASEATIYDVVLHNALGQERRQFPQSESIHLQFKYAGLDKRHRHFLQVRIVDYVANVEVYSWNSTQHNPNHTLPAMGSLDILWENVHLLPRQYHLEMIIYRQQPDDMLLEICHEVTSFSMFLPSEQPQKLITPTRYFIAGEQTNNEPAQADTISDR
jgi:ABC-type polysaccharide/polyol phosphate transport system ATPase subunit